MAQLKNVLLGREPLHRAILRFVDRHFSVLSYRRKLELGLIDRPNYGWPMLRQAETALKLGLTDITVVEFGVAGGNGLLAMERHAEAIERETGVTISIVGFDTGEGLPPLADFRDHPYLWGEGDYRMDIDALQATLRRSKLIIGRVEETLPEFLEQEFAPIAFISFDLDYYSSTKAALEIFNAHPKNILPRVLCYFDDVIGDIECGYTNYAGELLAINEFNRKYARIKIDRGIGFTRREYAHWQEQIFTAHIFDHFLYNRRLHATAADLSLSH